MDPQETVETKLAELGSLDSKRDEKWQGEALEDWSKPGRLRQGGRCLAGARGNLL